MLIFILFGCEKEEISPKQVFPDRITSFRAQNQIQLTWESPLNYIDVAPGFFDHNVMPESYEIYTSENDTASFVRIAELSKSDHSFTYPENEPGVNYFFKLKCLAENGSPSFSNMIWTNGGENTVFNSILDVAVDYTLELGDISNDGNKLLYSRNITNNCCENTHVMRYDLLTKIETQIIDYAFNPKWSPDEEHIVFGSHFGIFTTPRPTNLGIAHSISGEIEHLTDGENVALAPVFSRGGGSIFYLYEAQNEPKELRQYFFENRNSETLLIENGQPFISSGSLSLNAKDSLISFYGQDESGHYGIYAYDLNDKVVREFEMTKWIDYKASFSADGHYLAFHSDRSGRNEIWVKDLIDQRYYQLTGNDEGGPRGTPVWSKDSKKIYFLGYFDQEYGLYVIDFKP
jgi:Tol biopolymer transport system component